MKSQDIVVLLKLVSIYRETPNQDIASCVTARALEASLGISKSEVNASLRRSIDSGLALRDRKSGLPKVNKVGLLEFLQFGVRYVFPVRLGPVVRGMPTASSAPVFQGELMSAGELPPVWPDPQSDKKGQAIEPLYKSVPTAAIADALLYDLLALVDAIRIGNARERKIASALIEEKLIGG